MIRLRPIKREELFLLPGWFSEEETFVKWCGGLFTYPLTKAQLMDYYDTFEQDKNGWILAALDEAGTLVGHIMMRDADYKTGQIYFGLIVMAPETRGKGLGKEMLSQALSYVKEILCMKQTYLRVFDNNPAAKRCYEAVGFQEVGAYDPPVDFHGKPWSRVLMKAEMSQLS